MSQPDDIIVVGASARAAAQSVVRAGGRAWAVDLFADRDLRAVATSRVVPMAAYPEALVEAVAAAPSGLAMLLTGAMENHLDVVRQIAEHRRLIGPEPGVMAAMRDPGLWSTLALPQPWGAPHCPTRWAERRPDLRYVQKPQRSAGGRGIRLVRQEPSPGLALQQFIEDGEPLSVLLRAVGGQATLLGVTRQLIGEARFGSRHRFGYVGNVFPAMLNEAERAACRQVGEAITRRFGFSGVFGIDVMRDPAGRWWPVEVNPRYTAAMELIERAGGPGQETWRIPEQYDHLPAEMIADVPEPGHRVRPGQPICTVFADAASDQATCRQRLAEAADRVYTSLA